MFAYRFAYRFLLCAALAPVLAACSHVPRIPGITPYKMEIQQGNNVSQEALSQLKPGMTKDQVRFTLGTPLLTDIFHANRWDYIYWHEDAKGKREERKIALFFGEDGKLSHVEGDVVPAKPAPETKPAAETKPAPEAKQ